MNVDAHHHVWDLSRAEYRWMDRPHWGPIRRNYGLGDVKDEMRSVGIDATVVVQVANSTADTEHMVEAAAAEPMIRGIVAWVDLAEPSRAAAQLDRLAGAPVVGARHLLAMEPDEDWVLRPAVLDGIALLADRGLTFDVTCDVLRHLGHASTLARRFPALRLVVNHIGKPPIRDRGWEPWASLLAEAAAHPNVFAKLSGLTTPPLEGSSGEEWRPYVEHAVERFGAERLLYGSNWPVTLVAGSYTEQWEQMAVATSNLSADELAAVRGGTAVRCYGLDDAVRRH